MALEYIKLTLESNIYAPIKEFPSIAQRLVLVEAVLNNMTSAELDTLSTL